jgi:ApaG protein
VEISITNGIKISVRSTYRPDHSEASKNLFVFSYRIEIENSSKYSVQLLRRHWYISDSNGQKREVEGEGVIGEQPILEPRESYEYDSACDLQTDMGIMEGTYLMKNLDTDELFDVSIPKFKLQVPFRLN